MGLRTPREAVLRAKRVFLAVVGALALAGAGIMAAQQQEGQGGAQEDSADGPEQPIAFPHDLHAGKNQIPCLYCHYSADRSYDAGIPAVATCAGCHLPGSTAGDARAQPMVRADRPGVQQLTAYWKRNLPIPWNRVYNLPDYVRFPHMRHVKAGLQCQECHGPVQTMRVLRMADEANDLQMGWCVDCHRARNARADCFICHY
jgi:hypothetical protein